MTRTVSAVALALLLGGCASSEQQSALFSSNWQNDGGVSAGRLEQRLRAAPKVHDANLAVGVTSSGLVARDLSANTHWSYQGTVDTLPSIAGQLVVFSAGNDLVALDAKSGRLLWKVPTKGRKLRGAGDDGTLTVASLGGEEPGKSLLLAVTHQGDVTLKAAVDVEIGRPAALGGVGFVPWGDQYISAVDLHSGSEVARMLLRDLVSHAFLADSSLYFGEKALVRFDDKIRLADNGQGTRIELKPRELPGNPRWLSSGSETAAIDSSARQKIRLYATPSDANEKLHFANDEYLASYFKVAYGLAESDGKLLWARAFGADVVGAAVAASGFVVCDASGKVTELDAKGGLASEFALGNSLKACTVQASSLVIPPGQKAEPLAEQLASALKVLEPDMAAAQGFLLAELGKLDDPLVTKALIELSSSGRVPAEQRAEARKLLATRRTGTDFMLQALARHYDFVSGELPPPVGPLADALAAVGEQRAAPLLARHLNDPANSIDDVERAARALGKLATPAEYRELRTFFALYRATADDPGLVSAVTAVAGAILRVGGEEGRTLVERAAADPLTQPDVRRAISSLLPQARPEAQAAEAK
ncbi:MAG TPA: PQQ-binding-like beta-propeller repeat protein [Polyangiaceae bacterium]|nr:PQQ-binding-like beta-propeller repeat protein [Polyangiaceae bacterium]